MSARIEVDLSKVRKFMKKHNLSEPDLARRMGISYPMLYRVLRGKRVPGDKFKSGLIRAGMSPNDVFIFPKPLPSGSKAIV